MGQMVELSVDEQNAIAALKRLAKKWPASLGVLSWSGTLVVTKKTLDGRLATVATVNGIDNDGGDPDDDALDQNADIVYL